ncbi:DDE-type integrase/transposase/recombinase [Oligella urethralis]|uniref:Integrase n=1 Tax=Oligella urethralis DNF00040 TaxID=1401065 RepID=A0A096AID5_9BURK|nr:DDE-type integrase/transposase/recombinase [Oligella urethralis]KGF30472.1 integrase [Oligella urethralis DNF00040]
MTVRTETLSKRAQQWQSAGRGSKGQIVKKTAEELSMSEQTVYRHFAKLVSTPPRKRRSDAGESSITHEELLKIAAAAKEHIRLNGKSILPLEQNIERLRANRLIDATRICPETGEVVELSTSTIIRALRNAGLHPEQLAQPAPATRLASEHPNHVWQIDPSRCVMAYLPQGNGDNGLRIMNHDEFYKNKPANELKAIKHALWRYVIVDHTSGWIYVHYVTGGETAENISEAVMHAMIERPSEVMHGVPRMIMLDAGSANTSAIFKNLCRSMRIQLQVNTPGNPRSKGAVEKANDIVERHFESMLRTLPADKVQTLAQINHLAAKWRIYFNATQIHTRHGMTRNDAWLRIREHQLIIAPPLDVMQELAITAPEERRISTFLTVNYKGKEYDVSDVPGVMVGERLQICRNPSREWSAQAIVINSDGREEYHVLPEIIKNEFGFDISAPVIGESFSAKADTTASANVKAIELVATDSETLEEAEAFRKAQKKGKQAGLFGGKYDPLAAMEQTQVIPHLPRRGVAHDLVAKEIVMPMMTVVQAAKHLRDELGEWSPRHYRWLQENYPDGVRENELTSVADELSTAMGDSNVITLQKRAG